ncbi:MAG: cbb3-type cytochrome c oxidase subunit I [Acidobacteria bacterium]|nr:cbb3-type cytochrome c oxidase subunit I [Acidobacteriota bacterium]
MTPAVRLVLSHVWVAVAAFAVGALMAVMQALARAGVELPFGTANLYYLSVTAHGVLLALVFTTFFIMALGYLVVETTLGRIVGSAWAWAGFWLASIGTVITTVAILSGTSTVLYTFYPPLLAHPAFYIGATLLVAGSWVWCGVMIASFVSWRRANRGARPPLAAHGMLTTVIIWILATTGLAVEVVVLILPWSVGLVDRIDPIVARTYFWWFGHPLTYFWLVPAYVLWYTMIPRVAGGKLFSDALTRVVFIQFILFSTPVGFHHQFTDPGIAGGWKLLHTFTTYAIMFPSLVTAFTVTASLEHAGRVRGGTGTFGWIGKLPWRDPFFSSVALSMVTFALGGFGGAINAAYAMNAMIHNTAWVQGHFHLTVGTAVTLSFMGFSYWMLPRVTGRALVWPRVAAVQPYLWFVGMQLFSIPSHIAGLMGMPRRVYTGEFHGVEAAQAWIPLVNISAAGGVILFVSAMCWVGVLAGTMFVMPRGATRPIEYAEPLVAPAGGASLWDRLGLWTAVAVVLIIIAYAQPLYHLHTMARFPARGFSPF